jgi:hypothetical protein
MVKKLNLSIAFTIPKTLKNYIRSGKHALDPFLCQNVVYQINSIDCEASYVGQTKRRLKTRVQKHCNDIKTSGGSPSVISNHRIEKNHNFDWKRVKILDSKSSYYKRSISEMVHVEKQKMSLNKQSDTERFFDSYIPTLNLLSIS